MCRRSAFTLLEMAIVIAIIGLLIGGITAGQSYLRSASLNTMVQEARYYIDAFNRFENIYGTLPGDMATASSVWSASKAGGATHNGDGNGLISSREPLIPNRVERFYVFEHLADANIIAGSYTGLTGSAGASAAALGTNLPPSAIDQVGFYFEDVPNTRGYVSGSTMYYDGYYNHPLRVGKVLNENLLPERPFLTPQAASELDAKFDDGMPGTGWIRAPISSYATYGTDCTTGSTAYKVATKGETCWLVMLPQ
jgi:prepilin-type N-terminal cleavage/methylation domain-containing protein